MRFALLYAFIMKRHGIRIGQSGEKGIRYEEEMDYENRVS